MAGSKNLGKLVPTKKNVINKKTGSTSEITYYINPDKKIVKKRNKNIEDNKEEQEGKLAQDNKEAAPVPDKEENLIDTSNVKDFEDFGKKGIDPTVARQFFCNM